VTQITGRHSDKWSKWEDARSSSDGPGQKDFPDAQYYGYKIVHHMTAVVGHIEKFGFNTFDHPRLWPPALLRFMTFSAVAVAIATPPNP
jgi:hypothetical protein